MRPTLGLPEGSSLYKDLQVDATKRVQSRKKLEALDQTLDHFKLGDPEQRRVTAEAILRMTLLQHRTHNEMKPEPTDRLAVALWRITDYFRQLCQGLQQEPQ